MIRNLSIVLGFQQTGKHQILFVPSFSDPVSADQTDD
jgi:hypothetical protein